MMIKLKRAYEKAAESDGYRILVDRLWPRGLNKSEASVDLWLRDIAPSEQLRKWFSHDATKWPEFKQRYLEELTTKETLVRQVVEKAATSAVTLVYAAHDAQHNNAVVLREHIEIALGISINA